LPQARKEHQREFMNKIFDANGPLMVYLGKVADLIILSTLWFVCCIPIITIIPSTVALYYATLKIVREEENINIAKTFIRGFKENFKQSIVLSLIFLVLMSVLLMDHLIMAWAGSTVGMITSSIFLAMAIWTLCIAIYTCPLQAQFVNPVKQTLKNAALLATRKLGTTLYVFILHILPLIAAFISLEMFVLSLPIWVLAAPGLIAFFSTRRFVKIFDPMIKPPENAEQKSEA